MALIAIDWLRARGLGVPGDVSIVGFDGVPDGALSTPPLTTIAQPITEIGRRAARMILDHDGAVRRETMGVDFVIRGSTGPAPKA
jgi:DNA-binding LacI/PurR family transcriptional regulator